MLLNVQAFLQDWYNN